jgi:NADH:ubiquinone oxidoreductase subunit 4 (subunit M)
MNDYTWLFAALFIPLFPLSMLFNAVYQRINMPVVRFILVIVWPLPGAWLLLNHNFALAEWVIYWALATALLYAFRAVIVKEVGMWIGFLATSAWSLCWITYIESNGEAELGFHILSFAMPLALMSLLVGEIVHRYESAYAGIVSGVAQAQPRLSGALIIVMMAAIASPLFPAFFSMLAIVSSLATGYPLVAAGMLLLWLIWSWSGVRLLQELLVGPALPIKYRDISRARAIAYSILIVLLLLSGLVLSGVLL